MKKALPFLLLILVSCSAKKELSFHFDIPSEVSATTHQTEQIPIVDVVNLTWDYLDEQDIPTYIQISSSWGNIVLPIENKRSLKLDRKLFKKNDPDSNTNSDLLFILIYFADYAKVSDESVEIEGVVLSRQYDATINQNQSQ